MLGRLRTLRLVYDEADPAPMSSLTERRARTWLDRSHVVHLSAVTVLGTATFLSISWYLADKIRIHALRPSPGPAIPDYDDAKIIGMTGGNLRLLPIGNQSALAKPQLYGIAWDGGIGRLLDSATASGEAVTRPFNVVSGTAPKIGYQVALDRSYFLGDPVTELGLPMQEVIIPGPLGGLPAWYFPGRSETVVIGVHGQNGTRKDLLRIVEIVHSLNFSALAVTYRNDEFTPPDPSGFLRYGQTEWKDLEAAVQWSLEQGAQRVVLAGLSMGGGIVAAFLRNSPLADKVVRVILDSPMLDLHKTVSSRVRQLNPPLAGHALRTFIRAAELLASFRFDIDWAATGYLNDTSWLQVPTLVIHGDDDPSVPISTSIELQKMSSSLVALEQFPQAGHLESWNIDRSRYTLLIKSFLDRISRSSI